MTAAPASRPRSAPTCCSARQRARWNVRKASLDEVFARAEAQTSSSSGSPSSSSDVAGFLEALQDELAKVPQERVAMNIIRSKTGGIDEVRRDAGFGPPRR